MQNTVPVTLKRRALARFRLGELPAAAIPEVLRIGRELLFERPILGLGHLSGPMRFELRRTYSRAPFRAMPRVRKQLNQAPNALDFLNKL